MRLNFPFDIRNNYYKIQKVALFLLATILIVWMFPNRASFKYEFQKGKPWMHENLIAPYDFPVYKSNEQLSNEQLQVRDNLKPTFVVDESVYEIKAEEFISNFEQKWAIDKNLKKDIRFTFFNLNKKKQRKTKKEKLAFYGLNILENLYSKGIVQLIDDSGDTQQAATQIGRVYNLVSGSILNGVYSPKTYYGQVYPEQGVIVLNADTMNSQLGFGTVTGSNINGDNAFKLHTSISGAAVINANNGFQARNEERVQSTFYFVRAKNGEYNFSNNPSYVTGSNGKFRQQTFANNPKAYITTVGLYNSTQELLAVAKLSKPILKSFSNEVLVKVKLDF